jgi:hypothetical protein
VKHFVVRISTAAILSLAIAATAQAQSRPLATEDPETVPAGFILLEGGFDFLSGMPFPASGLKGDLFRIGTFGLSIGVNSSVELQIDGGLRRRLSITSFDPTAPLAGRYTGDSESTGSFDDLSIGAKIRFVTETESRPAFALRFATKLPNVGTENGLGTGTTDFQIALAAAKTVRSTRVAANFGMAIMAEPSIAATQNHLVTYGASVARAVATGVELVGEINGRLDAGDNAGPGTESRGGVRLGGRFTRGPVRFDGGFLFGITELDPDWGFTLGFTWVFKAFEVK